MISLTRIEDELTQAANTRYALIQLYVDASIFGYANRIYRCIKDIMTLYALEKALFNAVYYNFNETDIENLIYKIREFRGILTYVSNIDYFLLKYPNLVCPIKTTDNFTSQGDGQGNQITIINNTYPTSIIDNREEWKTQILTPLITTIGQTLIPNIDFNINNIDVDAVFLEVQGDNPDYGVNKAYHMVGNTLYWHNFYTLKPNMQILIRWKE